MADEYVRKDLFDAAMLRMDQRFDATERLVNNTIERMETMMDRNLAKHETIAARIEGKFDTMNARLDTLENKFSWNLAWVGIIMGLVLAIVQHICK